MVALPLTVAAAVTGVGMEVATGIHPDLVASLLGGKHIIP